MNNTRRVIDWPRRGDLVVRIPRSVLLDDEGEVIAAAVVSTITARVHAAGTAEPPGSITGREPVTLGRDIPTDSWVGALEYAEDLDTLTAARVIVTATIDGRPQCILDAAVRFVQAGGR